MVVHLRGQKVIESFWKWFSLKNMKLEEQLSFTSLLILVIFEKLYLVNFCPIFVSEWHFSKNNYIRLISVQNCTFGWMRNFLLQFWMDSNDSAVHKQGISNVELKTHWNKNRVFDYCSYWIVFTDIPLEIMFSLIRVTK